SGMDEEGHPTLATALRGILYTELRAKGPAVDLHSGTFGGVAPNPVNTLARVVGELKDRHGHVTIPGFYDVVREPSAEELVEWRKKDARYIQDVLQITGAKALEGEDGQLALARTGSRPTLDANGFIGGFTGKGAKTVIPAEASAKVSMRLVPDQDWKSILAAFEKHARSLSTPGVEISVEVIGAGPPGTLAGALLTVTIGDQLEDGLLAFRELFAWLRRLHIAPIFLAHEVRCGAGLVGVTDETGLDLDRLAAQAEHRLATRQQILRPVTPKALAGSDVHALSVGRDPDRDRPALAGLATGRDQRHLALFRRRIDDGLGEPIHELRSGRDAAPRKEPWTHCLLRAPRPARDIPPLYVGRRPLIPRRQGREPDSQRLRPDAIARRQPEPSLCARRMGWPPSRGRL